MDAIYSLQELNKVQWLDFYNYYKRLSYQINNIKYPLSLEEFTRLFKETINEPSVENYVFIKKEKIIARIELHLVDNYKTCNINFSIEDVEREDFSTINDFVNTLKKRFTSIRVESNNNILISQLKRNDFVITNTLLHLKLKRNYLIKNEISIKNYRLHFIDEINKVDIKRLAEIYNICLQEMIRKDTRYSFNVSAKEISSFFLDSTKYEKQVLFLFLKNKNNDIVGFTGVILPLKFPKVVEHIFTGILCEHRNQNLSVLMKEKLYERLFLKYLCIEEIRTDCFIDNFPIIKSNQKLGFKIYNRVEELIYS